MHCRLLAVSSHQCHTNNAWNFIQSKVTRRRTLKKKSLTLHAPLIRAVGQTSSAESSAGQASADRIAIPQKDGRENSASLVSGANAPWTPLPEAATFASSQAR